MFKKILPFIYFASLILSENRKLEFRHAVTIQMLEEGNTIDYCDTYSYVNFITQLMPFTYQAIMLQDDDAGLGLTTIDFDGKILNAVISKEKCSDNVFGLEHHQHTAMLKTLKQSCLIDKKKQIPLSYNWAVALTSQEKTKQTKFLMTTIISHMPEDKKACSMKQKNCLFFKSFRHSPILFCSPFNEEKVVEVKAFEQNQPITKAIKQ